MHPHFFTAHDLPQEKHEAAPRRGLPQRLRFAMPALPAPHLAASEQRLRDQSVQDQAVQKPSVQRAGPLAWIWRGAQKGPVM